jgi:LacI family transcriptional regulator
MKKNRPVRQIDIARKVGVHQTAVSAVLKEFHTTDEKNSPKIPEKTAQFIRKTALEMGYRPNISARELKGHRSHIIGMLMQPPAKRFYGERHSRLVNIEQVAYQRGYRIIIGHLLNPKEQIDGYVDDFLSRRVEGVLCFSHELPAAPGLISKQLSVLPNVVYFGRPQKLSNANYVRIDYSNGIQQAIRHLVSKGRKNIGIALMGKLYSPMIERLKGYRKGLKDAGMSIERNKIWFAPETTVLTEEMESNLIEKLIIDEKVDSIIAANDEWAFLLINTLQNRGIKVPDDVAIVGYENMSISQLSRPSITTVDCDYELAGQEMINMLLELMENPNAKHSGNTVAVKPKLAVRDSA